jgi:thiopurine S-methyltransferase
MDPIYWLKRWQQKEIGFHLSTVNPALLKFFQRHQLPLSARIFVPLCGKTCDLAWLMNQGYQVVGVELSELAITQLFSELEIIPTILNLGTHKKFSAIGIDIFVGDIFTLTPSMLGQVDAIYDRAALIALPPEMRKTYTQQLLTLTNKAPQLLLSYEYDQFLHPGPPFSVSEDEVKSHYQGIYKIEKLEVREVEGGIKGLGPAEEKVWLLSPKVI